ncbi:MAG: DUF3108 domain-containing protein [Aquificaceae bacterium]
MDKGAQRIIIFIMFFPLLSWAKELTACYRAYFIFIPVAETCIAYEDKGDLLHVSSFVRTINVGKLVKRVYNKGEALIGREQLNPVSFRYYQEEGEFKRYQEYRFNNGKIHVKEIKYKKLSDQIEKSEDKTYHNSNFVDPYTASLILYRDTAVKRNGDVLMFYDDRMYVLPYSVLEEDKVFTDAGEFETRMVEVYPNIDTKGLLKPKGKWFLWIDKKTYLPVKMKLGFVIGSIEAYLFKVDGDRSTLRNILEYN